MLSPTMRHAAASLRLRPSAASATKSRNVFVLKNNAPIRKFGDKANAAKEGTTSSAGKTTTATDATKSTSWWNSAETWGTGGAIAGWGVSGAAIYDAMESSPELVNLNMTGVLLVYSALFARWAFIVKPQNLLLVSCHVANIVAQSNQFRRAVVYKQENGKDDEVNDILVKAGATVAVGAACVLGGPTVQGAVAGANLGVVSTVAAAEAGPFTVHFWAPMSKWMISGASMMDLNIPTDKISLPQYTALTVTGFIFTRYALLVAPINYTLCTVNVALFSSSGWHLARKIKADYLS